LCVAKPLLRRGLGRLLFSKFFCPKCIFDLISVIFCFYSADDWQHIRQCYFTDPLQVISYLSLFVFKLLFIWQHLPLAPATNTKMRAKWFYPVRRIGTECQRPPLCPVFFAFHQLNVHHISRHRVFNKDHFAIHSCQRSSFSRIVLHPDVFQYDIFLFSSHGAKLNSHS
jgi:hypothetical protein